MDHGEIIQNALQRYVIEGGVVMIALVPCSFLAVGFIIRGLINLRRGAVMPSVVIQAIRAASPDMLNTAVGELAERRPCALSRLLARTLKRVRSGHYHHEETLSELVSEEIAVLYHRNSQLAVIYTVAPLLGLLGTVLGMMKTFWQFSQSKEPSVGLLAIGFNEALITTMWGLFIAVPSYIFLAIFRNRLFRYEQDYLPALVQELLEPALPSAPDPSDSASIPNS